MCWQHKDVCLEICLRFFGPVERSREFDALELKRVCQLSERLLMTRLAAPKPRVCLVGRSRASPVAQGRPTQPPRSPWTTDCGCERCPSALLFGVAPTRAMAKLRTDSVRPTGGGRQVAHPGSGPARPGMK